MLANAVGFVSPSRDARNNGVKPSCHEMLQKR